MTKADHDFRPGDLIRLIREPVTDHKIGDVSLVVPQSSSCAATSVCFRDKQGCVTWRPASYFELIARAGEPVTYLPGDVVECVRDHTTDGGFTPGKRYTLGAAYARNKATVEDDYGRHRYCDPMASNVYRSVKLVHRPDPAPVKTWLGHREGDTVNVAFQAPIKEIRDSGVVFGEPGSTESVRIGCDFPVNAAYFELVSRAAEPLTFTPPERAFRVGDMVTKYTWNRDYEVTKVEPGFVHVLCFNNITSKERTEGLRLVKPAAEPEPEPQVGDRVRVVYDVDVTEKSRPTTAHTLEALQHLQKAWGAKIEVIAPAEKPLAVGDRIRNTGNSWTGSVIGSDEDEDGDVVWVRLDRGGRRTYRRAYLERLP